jgi:hypothetical protein
MRGCPCPGSGRRPLNRPEGGPVRSVIHHRGLGSAVPAPTAETMFPVVRHDRVPKPAELRSLVKGRMPGASKQLQQALCDLEPYLGGKGEFVWLIHYLDLIDKHRLLVTVGQAYSSVRFDAAADLRGLADWTRDLPALPLGL